jgi:hypothetical protein
MENFENTPPFPKAPTDKNSIALTGRITYSIPLL